MAAGTIAAIAAVTSALIAGGSAWKGANEASHERKRARSAQAEQERAIAEEKARALETRKQQINQQRAQLGGTGAGTRGTNVQGIKANIGGQQDMLG